MKIISYAKLQKDYAGEYIGRKNSRIVAHAKSYSQLVRKLIQKHINRQDIAIGLVPPKSTLCIYAC
jgi:hypothetical protein